MATTWSSIDGSSVLATCTTGSESIAYNAAATAGIAIGSFGSLIITINAATATETVAGGSLVCYYYNSQTTRWVRYPDLDLSLGATTLNGYTFSGPSPGLGIPIIGRRGDRIAWIPSGVTVSAGNASVYHLVA